MILNIKKWGSLTEEGSKRKFVFQGPCDFSKELNRRTAEILKYGKPLNEFSREEQIEIREEEHREREEKLKKENIKVKEQIAKMRKLSKRGEKKGRIVFNRETGQIYIGRNKAGRLGCNSIIYYFFELLFDATPQVLTYRFLYGALKKRKKTDEDYSKTFQNYCYDLRDKIRKKFPSIAKIIVTDRIKNGERGYYLESEI